MQNRQLNPSKERQIGGNYFAQNAERELETNNCGLYMVVVSVINMGDCDSSS